MKILICTPCFGGLVTMRYLLSLIETLNCASQDGIQIGVFTLGNESLIPRARNDCAAEFLTSPHKWEKLLFIDADISWSYPQFLSLVRSDKPFVGGTYAVKKMPLSLNFQPLPQHRHYFEDAGHSVSDYNAYVKAEGNDENEIPVELLPTGFLLIDRSVLEHFQSKATKYSFLDASTGQPQERWDFFRSGAQGGNYLSEDWFFSVQCAKYDYQPYLKTDVIVNHEGSFIYGIN
jgi:hypothetical protein